MALGGMSVYTFILFHRHLTALNAGQSRFIRRLVQPKPHFRFATEKCPVSHLPPPSCVPMTWDQPSSNLTAAKSNQYPEALFRGSCYAVLWSRLMIIYSKYLVISIACHSYLTVHQSCQAHTIAIQPDQNKFSNMTGSFARVRKGGNHGCKMCSQPLSIVTAASI